MIKCPECGRENQDAAKICVYCGAMLIDIFQLHVSTRALENTDFEEGTPKWGTARFSARTNLILSVQNTDKKFIFDADQVEDLTIGRKDPQTGEAPDVDLLDSGALEKGVSRRHAAIVRKDGSLQIMDNGTPNGTFLNGQKLVPRQPRVVRDGDDIRLGHLVLHIQFQRE